MTGLVKNILKVAAVIAPVVGGVLFVKQMKLVNEVQQAEVDNLINESESNLETTLEIMNENNEVIIKEALVGIESRRKAQVKKAFDSIMENETYNTQLRFMNYNMWHNERIARNQAYQLVCILTLAYTASIAALLLFK